MPTITTTDSAEVFYKDWGDRSRSSRVEGEARYSLEAAA